MWDRRRAQPRKLPHVRAHAPTVLSPRIRAPKRWTAPRSGRSVQGPSLSGPDPVEGAGRELRRPDLGGRELGAGPTHDRFRPERRYGWSLADSRLGHRKLVVVRARILVAPGPIALESARDRPDRVWRRNLSKTRAPGGAAWRGGRRWPRKGDRPARRAQASSRSTSTRRAGSRTDGMTSVTLGTKEAARAVSIATCWSSVDRMPSRPRVWSSSRM